MKPEDRREVKPLRFPYEDTALPLKERVQDLVSRFTLEEKIELMMQYQPAVERLGVKSYKHGTEAAHGMAWLGEATSYPQPVGLACTWNPELLERIGSAIGDEARVFYRKDPAVNGLTLWAPTVDMERDPRWGRTEEAYGEDPYLTGALTSALVKGIQGDHPVYVKAVATLKHFLGNNNEINRGSSSSSIDPRNMKEYYQAAFKPAFVNGGALSMMTSYNSVNGTPAILLDDVKQVVKGEWGLAGFIVSDAGDLVGLVNDHRYYKTYKEAAAHSVKAGIDSITDDKDISTAALRQALDEGLLAEADLDEALANTFGVRFRLGEFDPDGQNPYALVPDSALLSPEHAALSAEAARESVVLLKNSAGLLPLDKSKLKQAAVIGALGGTVLRDWYSGSLPYKVTPLEAIQSKLFGSEVVYKDGNDRVAFYSGASGKGVSLQAGDNHLQLSENAAEIFEQTDWGWNNHTFKAESNGLFVTAGDDGRITASAKEVFGWYVKESFHLLPQEEGKVRLSTWDGKLVEAAGSEAEGLAASHSSNGGISGEFMVRTVSQGLEEAVAAAREAEAAVVFVGNNPLINGKEEIDRRDITLPLSQQELIARVAEVNANTVVVIVGSYPFALGGLEEKVSAILYTSHAGQELGNAVADVIFGDYNPAGRLNMTWYLSKEQLGDIMDYDIIQGGKTYQYFHGEPLYAFGHGLSYTTFEYGELTVKPRTSDSGREAEISVRVTNTGSRGGHEVVQLYVRAGQSRVKRPLKQLKGFSKLYLEPGESREVSFLLPESELAIWDVTRSRFAVEPGEYTIMIGRSSTDTAVSGIWSVEGEAIPPRDLTVWTDAVNYDGYERVYLDESKEGGSCIRPSAASGWIRFADAAWRDGIGSFEVRAAGGLDGGTIEIRLGESGGSIAGVCAIPPAGGSQLWTTTVVPVNGLSGSGDLYLRVIGDIGISRFRFL
jgi:beta-glucosidase